MYIIFLLPNMPIVSVNMMIHHDSPNADSSLDLQINLCLLMFQPTQDVSNTNLHWNLLDHIFIDQLLCLYNWSFPKSWGGTPKSSIFIGFSITKPTILADPPFFGNPGGELPIRSPHPTAATFAAGSLDASESSQQPYVKRTSKMKKDTMVNLQMGVSENSVPPNPMVNDHYPY
jgi:hypothetical protein